MNPGPDRQTAEYIVVQLMKSRLNESLIGSMNQTPTQETTHRFNESNPGSINMIRCKMNIFTSVEHFNIIAESFIRICFIIRGIVQIVLVVADSSGNVVVSYVGRI